MHPRTTQISLRRGRARGYSQRLRRQQPAWCNVLPLAPPPAIINSRCGLLGILAEVEWVLGPLFSLVRSPGITEEPFPRVSCAGVDPALPIPVVMATGNVSHGRRFSRAPVVSPLRYRALGDPLEPLAADSSNTPLRLVDSWPHGLR